MAITIQDALDLTPGTILSFGTEHVYAVVSVESRNRGKGVYITLRRDDGYETFATENDLKKIVRPPEDAHIPPEFGVDLIPKWEPPNAGDPNGWDRMMSDQDEVRENAVRYLPDDPAREPLLAGAQVNEKVESADAPETIVTPNVTAEELEALGSDPNVQQVDAAIAAEEKGELPSEPYDVVATTTNSVTDEVSVNTIHIDPAEVNVFPVDGQKAELPSEPVSELPPTEAASPLSQDGDDTAVDNKPASKGKGKSKKS